MEKIKNFKRTIRFATFLFFNHIFIFNSWGNQSCLDQLTSLERLSGDTKKLAQMIDSLVQQREISLEKVYDFMLGLEEGNLINPLDNSLQRPSALGQGRLSLEQLQNNDLWPTRSRMGSSSEMGAFLSKKRFQEILGRNSIDRFELHAWLNERFGTDQTPRGFSFRRRPPLVEETKKDPRVADKVEVQKPKQAETKTIEPLSEDFEFIDIPAGGYPTDLGKTPKRITLTHPFEVMSKPVTQEQWARNTGVNPSHFKTSGYSIVVKGDKVMVNPNHPVENITWWSAILFANLLSERAGLEPVYDVSHIKWTDGSFEAGTLKAEKGSEPIINAPDGNYYKAFGYRLLTEAELRYLLMGVDDLQRDYYFGYNDDPIAEHAWFSYNSNQRTHPVGKLNPLVVGDKNIYDVLGNVQTWGYDHYQSTIPTGENPLGTIYTGMRISSGGSYKDSAYNFRFSSSTSRGSLNPNHAYMWTGLRLGRTLP